MSQSQKCIYFEKKCPKIKINYFPLMTTFYNFALKTETSYAKNVVKPILKSWYAANDVFVYVWLINSLIKTF